MGEVVILALVTVPFNSQRIVSAAPVGSTIHQEERCIVWSVCKKCDEGGLYVGTVEGRDPTSAWCLKDSYLNNNIGYLGESPRTQESGVNSCVSNPVNFVTGYKIEGYTDYIGGGAFPLQVTRTYSSNEEKDISSYPSASLALAK